MSMRVIEFNITVKSNCYWYKNVRGKFRSGTFGDRSLTYVATL